MYTVGGASFSLSGSFWPQYQSDLPWPLSSLFHTHRPPSCYPHAHNPCPLINPCGLVTRGDAHIDTTWIRKHTTRSERTLDRTALKHKISNASSQRKTKPPFWQIMPGNFLGAYGKNNMRHTVKHFRVLNCPELPHRPETDLKMPERFHLLQFQPNTPKKITEGNLKGTVFWNTFQDYAIF